MEHQNKKHSLLLATKLEELPDASNAEEYDQ